MRSEKFLEKAKEKSLSFKEHERYKLLPTRVMHAAVKIESNLLKGARRLKAV